MELAFKPDWEETKERYRAFWAHEYFGRAAIGVTAQRDNVPDEPWPTRPATPQERWTNLDYAAACIAEVYLMEMWCEVHEEFYRIVREASEGSTCWFGFWSPGKTYAAQNDFAYMIGPAMFRELFLPIIERQTRYLDHTVYHVDGVGNFAHVPALCELPRLQAIQIAPGAGKPSPLHYMDTLKTVQAAGKNLQISLPPEEVQPALELLSARGLFISTWCRTETEALELLKNAKRWSADRG